MIDDDTGSSFHVAPWGKRRIVWVDSARIDECVNFCRRNSLDGLGVNAMHGYELGDVNFLSRHPDVGGLVVVPGTRTIDASGVRHLKNLRFLSLSDNRQETDLDAFPLLEEFRGDWHKGLHFSECSQSLCSLHLWHYKPTSRDLSTLPFLGRLNELGLTQTSIAGVCGLERFQALKTLEIAYARNLESLSLATYPQLETLICENCPRLGDYEALTEIGTLRVLRLNACGALDSLSLLNSLPKLEEFRFVNTDVRDGNLCPLLRLRRVGFLNKKHFSHTREEIEASLRDG